MALVGNRSVLHKSPGRFLAGTVASGDRSNFDKPGMQRNSYEVFSDYSAIPNGHIQDSAWILPRKGGNMSSHNAARVVVSGVAGGALGVNIVGAADMTFSADAVGQLIASAAGAASFSFDATGNLIATIGGQGSASFTVAAAGTAGAIAWAQGTATMGVTATLVRYAVGFMSGTTDVSVELTAEQVATEVWAAKAAINNTTGSMGEKVNSLAAGVAPTAQENADAVWQHAFVGKLLTVAKYLGLK